MTIFCGGGLGALARYVLSILITRQVGNTFPWSTLAINLCGAFGIGLVTAWGVYKFNIPPTAQLFLVTGFLGGFTTFSAFSLETTLLLTQGHYLHAALYSIASVVGTVLLVFAAHLCVRGLS